MAFMQWNMHPKTLFSISPIIPVIVINHLADALPLAEALLVGGLKVLEVTLRTNCALAAISLIREAFPDAIIGAGTVCTPHQFQQAIDAGAQFALSPGLTNDLLLTGQKAPIPFIPGIASVSELMHGIAVHYSYFKFFPAEVAGGTAMLKALHGPFPKVRFCPTGGIADHNFLDYLALPNVECVGGSWVIPEGMLKEKKWANITKLCKTALQKTST